MPVSTSPRGASPSTSPPPTCPGRRSLRPGHRTRHPRRQRPVARHRPRRPGVPWRTGPVRGDPASARRIAGRAGGARRKARSGGTEGKCRRGQPGQRADGVRRGPPAGDRRTPLRPGPAAALPGPRPAPRALPLSRPGRGPGPGRRQARPAGAAGAHNLFMLCINTPCKLAKNSAEHPGITYHPRPNKDSSAIAPLRQASQLASGLAI